MKPCGCPALCQCQGCALTAYQGLSWEFLLHWQEHENNGPHLRFVAHALAGSQRSC